MRFEPFCSLHSPQDFRRTALGVPLERLARGARRMQSAPTSICARANWSVTGGSGSRIDLDRVEDIESMPFDLLTNAASRVQCWNYEFLLMRAIARQSVDAMLFVGSPQVAHDGFPDFQRFARSRSAVQDLSARRNQDGVRQGAGRLLVHGIH
jgi:hypothetical protein